MLAFLIAAGAVFLAVAVSAAIDLIRPSLDYDGTTPLPVGAGGAGPRLGWVAAVEEGGAGITIRDDEPERMPLRRPQEGFAGDAGSIRQATP